MFLYYILIFLLLLFLTVFLELFFMNLDQSWTPVFNLNFYFKIILLFFLYRPNINKKKLYKYV